MCGDRFQWGTHDERVRCAFGYSGHVVLCCEAILSAREMDTNILLTAGWIQPLYMADSCNAQTWQCSSSGTRIRCARGR